VPRIIARKDRGIQGPKDLSGKHIATQEASAVHFFLSMFLLNHAISEQDVELSFKKAEELPGALAAGEIDAFSMREPFISQAKALLGDNALIFAEPGIYSNTFNLISYNNYIRDNPEQIRKILLALIQAEEFAKNQPDEAIRIISNRLGIAESEVDALWPELNLKISLHQSLLRTLEDEARWAIENNLTDKTEIPNYLDYISIDALEEVKPEAVTIIR
jgi:NitT/TauT family transport system substrate-binding protein